MSHLPAPTAARLRPARWRDARLIVGVVLVLLSVVVGVRVVSAAGEGTLVWAAARPLGPGQSLVTQDLQAVTVRLADPSRYLTATGRPPVGYQVVRAVGPGELVPAAALAAPGSVEIRRVVLGVPADTVEGLRVGAQVDVYVVPAPDTNPIPPAAAPAGVGDPAGAGAPTALEATGSLDDAGLLPRLVLEAATVAGVGPQAGFAAGGSTASVALYVDNDQVPAVLAATAAGTAHVVQRVGGSGVEPQ